MPVLQLDLADLLFRGLVEDLDVAAIGADVEQAVAAVQRDAASEPLRLRPFRRRVRSPLRDHDARMPIVPRTARGVADVQGHVRAAYFLSGKIRSILRQSFWAAAHFAVQSGA